MTPFTYTGREPSLTGELLYLRARFYLPGLGRFTQPDPMGFVDGVNRYAYVKNSPVNYVDPTGMLASMNFAMSIKPTYTAPIQLHNNYVPSINSANYAALLETGYCTSCKRISINDYYSGKQNNDSAVDQMLSFVVPAYDLAKNINNPNATGFDYAVDLLGIIPVVGKEASLGLKAGRAGLKSVANNVTTGREFWSITKEGTERVVEGKFGKIYKSTSDGLWWSKDTAGHGGSEWKVFNETSKGLEWYRDADKYGDFIVNKHKGETGMLIPWKELNGSKF